MLGDDGVVAPAVEGVAVVEELRVALGGCGDVVGGPGDLEQGGDVGGVVEGDDFAGGGCGGGLDWGVGFAPGGVVEEGEDGVGVVFVDEAGVVLEAEVEAVDAEVGVAYEA